MYREQLLSTSGASVEEDPVEVLTPLMMNSKGPGAYQACEYAPYCSENYTKQFHKYQPLFFGLWSVDPWSYNLW